MSTTVTTTDAAIAMLDHLAALKIQVADYFRQQAIIELKAIAPSLQRVSFAIEGEYADDGTTFNRTTDIELHVEREGIKPLTLTLGDLNDVEDINEFLSFRADDIVDAANVAGIGLSEDGISEALDTVSDFEGLDDALRPILDALGITSFNRLRLLVLNLLINRTDDEDIDLTSVPTFNGIDGQRIDALQDWSATIPNREPAEAQEA